MNAFFYHLEQPAWRRYGTVRLAVRQTVDLDVYYQALERLAENLSAVAVSRHRQEGRRSVSSRDWRAWLSPPCSFRVEHCATRDQITEISGGDCFIRWQFFSATLKGYTVDLGSRGGELTVAADMPLPLVISELVDGSFLWTVPEGARREPELKLVGTSELLGRKVLRLHLEVKDWSTRFVGWSETVLVADNYELLLDRQSGIILRIGCWIDRA